MYDSDIVNSLDEFKCFLICIAIFDLTLDLSVCLALNVLGSSQNINK